MLMQIGIKSGAGPLSGALAIVLSRFSNGWIYLPIAAMCLLFGGRSALGPMLASGISAGVLHCIYPILMRRVARPRPFVAMADVRPLLAAMDEHSFPSGHTMTLTAVLLPIVLAFPPLVGVAVLTWFAVAWARVASAHHYPSDVLAGTVMGAAVGYPFGIWAATWIA